MAPKKTINLVVLGVGGVGQSFLEQLPAFQAEAASSLSTTLNLVYVANSNKAIFNFKRRLQIGSIAELRNQLDDSGNKAWICYAFPSWLAENGHPSIIVDNTSSEDVAQAYPFLLSKGISIVTPNKKAFSLSQSLWDAIFPQPRPDEYGLIYHEGSVCANLPVLSVLRDLLLTGDNVVKIQGVLSGSLSFLLHSFSTPDASGAFKSWSSEVAFAQNAGYTEPDPRDDLSGLDVARKLVILARLIGLKVKSPTSFPVDSLIPPALTDCSREEFLQRLPDFDNDMANLRDKAKDNCKVLCHVGTIDVATSQLRVGLESLDRSHPLANLPGEASSINFYTERFKKDPLVVTGVVGGGDSTATAVMADLARVLREI